MTPTAPDVTGMPKRSSSRVGIVQGKWEVKPENEEFC
jgi:hypothetical protein